MINQRNLGAFRQKGGSFLQKMIWYVNTCKYSNILFKKNIYESQPLMNVKGNDNEVYPTKEGSDKPVVYEQYPTQVLGLV